MAYPLAEQEATGSHSEVVEQVHSRINELMALHKFMDDANIKSGSKTAETIMNMWTENKMPHIKQYPWDAPMWGGQTGRAFYGKSDDFPVSPDTLNIKKGRLDDFIAEMSHAVQYSVPQSVRDSLSTASRAQRKKYAEGAYGFEKSPYTVGRNTTSSRLFFPSTIIESEYNKSGKEGIGYSQYTPWNKEQDVPVEFQAHSIIQPLLEERIKKAKGEDWETENPWITKLYKFLDNQK